MKTIGIIGGIGPESTILYYRRIIQKFKELDKSGNYPNIIINSINLKECLAYAVNAQYDNLTDMMVTEIKKLEQANVDFAILAANTSHIVYNKVADRVTLPLLSVVDETCKAIKETGIIKAALFGTSVTMQGGFYEKTACNYDIEIILPKPADREYIDNKYVTELIPGIIKQDTKKRLIEIIEDLKIKKNVEGLILGGTELSLILKQEDMPGFTIFDTTIIHADSAVKYSLS